MPGCWCHVQRSASTWMPPSLDLLHAQHGRYRALVPSRPRPGPGLLNFCLHQALKAAAGFFRQGRFPLILAWCLFGQAQSKHHLGIFKPWQQAEQKAAAVGESQSRRCRQSALSTTPLGKQPGSGWEGRDLRKTCPPQINICSLPKHGSPFWDVASLGGGRSLLMARLQRVAGN